MPAGAPLPFLYNSAALSFHAVALPNGATGGIAYGIGDDGKVVGAALEGGTERAFSSKGEEADYLPINGVAWSRAYDLGLDESIVGTYRTSDGWPRGFAHTQGTATFNEVDLDFAVATWVLGAGPSAELAGAFVDPSGNQHGFVARPVAGDLGVATVFRRAAEPSNPGVAHACGHSVEGPFRVLRGAEVAATAPVFETPHTSYTIMLLPETTSHLVYRSLGSGPVSFFVHPAVTLRLFDEAGTLLPPTLVRRSTLCPKISWAYQFAPPDAGDYSVVIDPNPHGKTYLILERSWAYEPQLPSRSRQASSAGSKRPACSQRDLAASKL